MKMHSLLQKALVSVMLVALSGIIPEILNAVQQDSSRYASIEVHAMTLSQLQEKFYKTEIDDVISIEFENLTLEEALSRIARQAELKLTYRGDSMIDKKVSLKSEIISVSDALASVLEGTGLDYMLSRDGYLLIAEVFEEEIFQESVSGRVIDAQTGESLPGVNIIIEGTSTGTTTDLDGIFELGVPTLDVTLRFSYIGYTSVEINIDGRQEIDVELVSGIIGGEELVVIGYGSMQREDLTGSVGTIDTRSLREVNVTNVEQAILGRIAGVQVKPYDGTPGTPPSVTVRGVGSISAGMEPLYVVDGFPVSNLHGVNPGSIERIDVLKDASSTAIYGSRGSNGVVIITTNRGQSGTTQYSINTSFGLQEMEKKPVYMTAEEMAFAAYWGARNTNTDLGRSVEGHPRDWVFPVPQIALDILEGRETPTESEIYGTSMPNNDWLDLVTRVAPVEKYQLSASGGSEDFRFAITGEYLNQDGIVVNTNFKRFSLQGNFDTQLSEKLTVNLNLNPSFNVSIGEDPSGTGYGTGAISNAVAIAPWTPVYGPDGDYFLLSGLEETGNYPNAVAIANEVFEENDVGRFRGNIKADYEILDELTFNIMLGANFRSSNRTRFVPHLPSLHNSNAFGREDLNLAYNWVNEYTLNYINSFGEHEIIGLAGFAVEKSKLQSNFMSSNAFPNNIIPYLSATGGILNNGSSTVNEWSLLSNFGRLNYSFKNRYLITFTTRIDGSSRFGADRRYGVFPSAALAWRISNEEFLQDLGFLSNLKLRASYGISGNNQIGNYESLATVANVLYPRGNNPAAGYVDNRISNPSLTWESQYSYNAGLDMGFFEDRFNFIVNYYNTINKDLLLNVNIPTISGHSTELQNIGEIENKGWEFEINSANTIGTFQWSTNFNISTNKNKVLSLGPKGDPIISGRHITQVGEPIGMFYGLIWDGIFKTAEELEEGPIYNPGAPNETRVGDIRFKDISGPDGIPDGIINSYDRVPMGSPHPDFHFGMTNQFSYKNFGLSISLQGVYGNDIYSLVRVTSLRSSFRRHLLGEVNNFWISEEEPGDGVTPRPHDTPTGGIREASTYKLDDGSYLRVSNITLSYTVPLNIAQRFNLNSARLYVNTTNPFLFSRTSGFNPDVTRPNNALTPGEDFNQYPLAKSLSIGLNLDF